MLRPANCAMAGNGTRDGTAPRLFVGSSQFTDETVRGLEICCLESFREPVIHGHQSPLGSPGILISIEARQSQSGPQLPRERRLCAREVDRTQIRLFGAGFAPRRKNSGLEP